MAAGRRLTRAAAAAAAAVLRRSSPQLISAGQHHHTASSSLLKLQKQLLPAAARQALQHQPAWRVFALAAAGATTPQRGFAWAAAASPPPPPPPPPAEAEVQQQQHQDAAAATAAAADSSAAAPASSLVDPALAVAAAEAAAQQQAADGQPQQLREFSMRQVARHGDVDSGVWIVVNDKVYDVSSYLDDHPGGAESILNTAGADATEDFMAVHSQEARQQLERFLIGRVKQGASSKAAAAAAARARAAAQAATKFAADGAPILLADPQARYALPLAEKRWLSEDTVFMRFALPTPRHRLGLPCGKHVFCCADIDGEPVARAYTPVSGDRDAGVLDLLIKVYWPCERFPQGGKMTQHLAAMKEGDTVEVKGPFGKFEWQGGADGGFLLNRVPGSARYLSMVAGGSGVTPCFAVAREVLSDPADARTKVCLIYANKRGADVWLHAELDALARQHPDRLHVWYVVEEPPPSSPKPSSASSLLSSSSSSAAAGAGAAAAAAAGGAPAAAAAAAMTAAGAPLAGGGGEAACAGVPFDGPFGVGRITVDMMASHLLPPRVAVVAAADPQQLLQQQQHAPQSLALMCGPPGMLEGVVIPGLKALGFSTEQMVVF